MDRRFQADIIDYLDLKSAVAQQNIRVDAPELESVTDERTALRR